MEQSDVGSLPFDGPRHALNGASNNLHLHPALTQQGLPNSTLIAGPTRPKHNHDHDGRYLPSLLSLLCLNQYRGHETFHIGSAKRPLLDSHGHRPEKLS